MSLEVSNFFIGLILAALLVQQAAVASSLKTKVSQNENWSGALDLILSEKMIREENQKSETIMSLEALGGYQFSKKLQGSFSTLFYDNQKNPEDPANGFGDLSLVISSLHLPQGAFAQQKISGFVGLPLSRKSREREDLQGSLAARYGLALKSSNFKNWGLGIGASIKKWFYEFDTLKNGEPVSSYYYSEDLDLRYEVRFWQVQFGLSNYHLVNELGRVEHAFSHFQEVTYKISKTWSLSVGHSNSGPWQKDRLQSPQLQLIDDKSSFVFFKTGVLL